MELARGTALDKRTIFAYARLNGDLTQVQRSRTTVSDEILVARPDGQAWWASKDRRPFVLGYPGLAFLLCKLDGGLSIDCLHTGSPCNENNTRQKAQGRGKVTWPKVESLHLAPSLSSSALVTFCVQASEPKITDCDDGYAPAANSITHSLTVWSLNLLRPSAVWLPTMDLRLPVSAWPRSHWSCHGCQPDFTTSPMTVCTGSGP
ncbi:hypothetical protein J6590_077559 [Homalodisca vitripennis]|nr:hypothetical protein J6590_077559 [Homalodisca vitripennis]